MTNLHSILCWVHMEANYDTFQYPTCVNMLKLKSFEKRIASTHKAVKNEAKICFYYESGWYFSSTWHGDTFEWFWTDIGNAFSIIETILKGTKNLSCICIICTGCDFFIPYDMQFKSEMIGATGETRTSYSSAAPEFTCGF